MSSSYPGSSDAFDNPSPSDILGAPTTASKRHAAQHTLVNDAVLAIQTELGTMPSGEYTTVAARLDALKNDIVTGQTIADGTNAVTRDFTFQTSGSKRWTLTTNTTTESGTATGSDFEIRAFNNSGSATSTALGGGVVVRITRSTGAVAVAGATSLYGTLTTSGTASFIGNVTMSQSLTVSGSSVSVAGNLLMTNNSAYAKLSSRVDAGTTIWATVPVGAIMPFAGTTPPPGWLVCNGQAVNRYVYSALFAAIYVTYGSGDGSNTFNVPNLVNRFPLGRDTGGLSLGSTGGSSTKTLQWSEIPPHWHAVSLDHGHTASMTAAGNHSHSATFATSASTTGATNDAQNIYAGNQTSGRFTTGINQSGVNGHVHAVTVNDLTSTSVVSDSAYGNVSAGTDDFSILPPYIGLTYIIKY